MRRADSPARNSCAKSRPSLRSNHEKSGLLASWRSVRREVDDVAAAQSRLGVGAARGPRRDDVSPRDPRLGDGLALDFGDGTEARTRQRAMRAARGPRDGPAGTRPRKSEIDRAMVNGRPGPRAADPTEGR